MGALIEFIADLGMVFVWDTLCLYHISPRPQDKQNKQFVSSVRRSKSHNLLSFDPNWSSQSLSFRLRSLLKSSQCSFRSCPLLGLGAFFVRQMDPKILRLVDKIYRYLPETISPGGGSVTWDGWWYANICSRGRHYTLITASNGV